MTEKSSNPSETFIRSSRCYYEFNSHIIKIVIASFLAMLFAAVFSFQCVFAAAEEPAVSAEDGPQSPLDAENVVFVNKAINDFIDKFNAGKIDDAKKCCANRGENFITSEFETDFKLFSGFKRKISGHTGNPQESVSAVVTYETGDDEQVTQEFALIPNEKGDAFLIMNAFDRQYSKIGSKRKECCMNCGFLDAVWAIYPETLPARAMATVVDFGALASAGLLKATPSCPESGTYGLIHYFDGDAHSYEVRVKCSKHGGSWEIFKVAGNLDDSEKLASEIGAANSKKAAEYGTDLLVKLMAARDRANEVIKMVQNDDLNEAIKKFREYQKADGRLGDAYVVLARALADSGHSTEAVELLKEGFEVYPKWDALHDVMAAGDPSGPGAEKPSKEKPKDKSKDKIKDRKK